jgi:hypothetical protein
VADAVALGKLMIEHKKSSDFWIRGLTAAGISQSLLAGAAGTATSAGSTVALQTSKEAVKVAGTAAACLAGSFFFSAAVAKVIGMGVATGVIAGSCGEISKFQGFREFRPGDPADAEPDTEKSRGGTGHADAQSRTSSPPGFGAPGAQPSSKPAAYSFDSPAMKQLMAKEGAKAGLLEKLPNRRQLPQVAARLGVTPASLGQGLLKGGSLSSALAGTYRFPPAFQKYLGDLERKIALEPSWGVSATPTTAGGLNTAPGRSLKLGLGEDTAEPLQSVSTTSFSGRPLGYDPNDIWHAGHPGTIFQIVSERIEQGREKVERMDWEIPINRRQHGLPMRGRDLNRPD